MKPGQKEVQPPVVSSGWTVPGRNKIWNILYWCYLWNENSVQFRIIYSIDNLFIRGRSFYIKSRNWGRELDTGEKERECECRWMKRRASVGNPVAWGKHVFTRKGNNAAGDRLRLMRNMRKMDNDISHRFDLQMFLMIKDILSNRQFVFSIKRPNLSYITLWSYRYDIWPKFHFYITVDVTPQRRPFGKH